MRIENSRNVPALLVYEGEVIHARDEMLSLTDMWRAGKSDPARQPSNWLASADAKRFIEVLEVLDPGNSGVQTKRGGRGIGGSTFAHWQIGLAYAKYLSPSFHMWCNTVVRERMEGKQAIGFPADLAEKIDRIFGIERMLSHKVTEVDKAVAKIEAAIPSIISQTVEAAISSDPRRAVLNYVSVRQLLDDAKAIQKGRRRLNRKVGFAIRDRAAQDKGGVAAKCPHTGVWLFQRAFADKFMSEVGVKLVKAHNESVSGQGVFKLVRPAPISDAPSRPA